MEQRNQKSRLPAFFLGLIVGLILMFALLFAKNAFNKAAKTEPISETQGLAFDLRSPVDGEVVTTKSVRIEGNTGIDSIVVVTGGVDDVITEAKSGKFSTNVDVEEGENELLIYAFNTKNGESIVTAVNILYLEDEITSSSVLIASSHRDETQKEKIENLRQKLATASSLKKKLSEQKRSHIFGTISAISNNTLTVETKKGDFKTIFTDELTIFYSIGQGGKQTINLADLKVGDKISVIGVSPDESVSPASHIAKLNRPIAKRHAIIGKVKSRATDTITLTHITQSERTFTINLTKDTQISSKDNKTLTIENIKEVDVIVASGTIDEKGLITAKRVFVIPGQPTAKKSTPSATTSSL